MSLITQTSELLKDSSISVFSMTAFLSFLAVGYLLKGNSSKKTVVPTKENSVEDHVDENLFQAWSGMYMHYKNSLYITIVRKKINSKKKNIAWKSWNEENDSSVITRNFYMGNSNPSFEWSFNKEGEKTEATVKETMTDGWNSVIQMKLSAYIEEEWDSDKINLFVKKLIDEEKIEWQKTLLTKEQCAVVFA